MLPNDRALAYALLRLSLGINICFHGVQRLPILEKFATGMIKNFDGVLPAALVAPYAYTVPFAEAIIGALLVVGLAQRPALIAGSLLMASLTFGTALRAQHDVLFQQLGYELVYFVLLAVLSWDRISLDAIITARRRPRGNAAAQLAESLP